MDPPTFNIAVVIPYADTLSKLMNGGEVRLRRDFSTVLGLIDAHAIIHMMTRRRDKEGRIVATLADYAKVRDLSAEWGIDAAELEAGAAEAAEAAEFLPFVAPF